MSHLDPIKARAPGGGRYELRALAANEAELLIYGEIGDDWMAEESNSARTIVNALDAAGDVDYLSVRVNSYGGVVADGLAIHNALLRHRAAVTVTVDGVAFSIASLIAMAGDTVRVAENAMMMLHAPWGMAMGNARDLRELAAVMDKYAEAMATAYARKTGTPVAEWVALLQDGDDHYYTAAEAIAAGLADFIAGEPGKALAASLRDGLATRYAKRLPAAVRAALEIPIPATPAATPPRSAAAKHEDDNTMTDDANRANGSGGSAPADKPTNVIEINAAREDAIRAERERIAEIQAIGQHHPQLADDAAKAITAGTTLDAFRAQIIPKLSTGRPGGKDAGGLDFSAKERGQYSLIRAIRAHTTGDWQKAGFERECSIAVASELKRDPRGFFVPTNIGWATGAVRPRATMQKGDDSAGGYLVHTERGDFIDSLRARSMVFDLGARRLGGLVGDMSMPKKTASGTFTWVAEDGSATDSDLGTGAILMQPRTAAGAVPMTRKLLLQSSPDVEMLVRDDLLLGAALAVDSAAIQGTGVDGQPLGLTGITGVNTQSVSSAGDPTWTETVGFETAVASDNALMGTMAYLTTPAVRGAMKVKAKDSGSGMFVWEGGEVNGYRAEASTQVPTAEILFGNWSELMIGFWGAIDIKTDEATKVASGGLVLRCFVDCDVAVRHAESFCRKA